MNLTWVSETVEKTSDDLFIARVVLKAETPEGVYNVGVAHVGSPCTEEAHAQWVAAQEFADRLQTAVGRLL